MANIGKFRIESAGQSDIGRRNATNQDALLLLERHGVFCVADGVGSGEHSEEASRAVVRELESAFTALPTPGTVTVARDPESVARLALNRASAWINERAWEPDNAGMASTAIILVFRPAAPERAFTLHAGDSRCYRWREGILTLLTRDHSGAELLGIREGQFVPPGFRNLITRAVGSHPRITLERTAIEVQEGDLYLLCSDGLNRMLPDSQIADILKAAQHLSLQQRVDKLIQKANSAGGHDNITTILVSVNESKAGFARNPEISKTSVL